jgi:predicted transcriptional regulator
MTETKQAQSSGSAMSAMMAVLKLYYMCQETYSRAMLALHQAQTTQCRLQGHVRRLRRAARDAQTHIANAMTALEARRNQFVNAIRERDEAEA